MTTTKPPAMEVTNTMITSYSQYDPVTGGTRIKRAALDFSTTGVIRLTNGSNGYMRITNLGPPVSNGDAVTKEYTDNIALGVRVLSPVRAVFTTQVALASLVAGNITHGFQTTDGDTQSEVYALAEGQRILLIGQATPQENGLYLVAAVGGSPVRTGDLADGSSASNVCVMNDCVLETSFFFGNMYMCVSPKGSDIVGANDLVFNLFSKPKQPAKTDGLYKPPVRAASVVAHILSALVEGAVVDGVTLGAGDRLLLRAQEDKVEQGIWQIQTGGSAPTRPDDFRAGLAVSSAVVYVLGGETNQQRAFVCTAAPPADLVGQHELPFAEFTSTPETRHYLPPVFVASTDVNIDLIALKEGSKVDGLLVSAGKRVLLGAQRDPRENGVWVVTKTDVPVRPPDFPVGGSASGTLLYVVAGDLNVDRAFMCTNLPGTDTVGTDALVFRAFADGDGIGSRYKPPVRAAATTDVALSALTVGSVVDGEPMEIGDRVLLAGQSVPVENGIYSIQMTAPPVRARDLQTGGATGALVYVRRGTGNGACAFVCSNDEQQDRVGIDALTFVKLTTTATEGESRLKATALAASVANVDIGALASGSVVDGFTCGTGARVLLRHQTNAVENGIYAVRSVAPAERTLDLPNGSTAAGVVVHVLAGATHAGRTYVCNSHPALGGDLVGTHELSFVPLSDGPANGAARPVRVAITANKVIDDVKAGLVLSATLTLAVGDRVLLCAQTPARDNGIYVVQATSAPERAFDLATGGRASGVLVREAESGNYYVCTNGPGVDEVGQHDLVFTLMMKPFSDLYKRPVMATSTTDLVLDNIVDGCVVDGVTLRQNDRVLLIGQADKNQNGVFVVAAAGKRPARSADFGGYFAACGTVFYTLQGTERKGRSYICTAAVGALVGVDALPFDEFFPSSSYANLYGGNVFEVTKPDGTSYPTGSEPVNEFRTRVRVTNTMSSTSFGTGALEVTGGVYVGGDLWTSNTYNMSDIRLKQSITALEADRALDIVAHMSGCTFTWADHPANAVRGLVGKESVGLIAQEVEAAGASLCVTRTPKEEESNYTGVGGDDDTPYMAVEYTKIIPYLVEAIKALKRRLDDQQEQPQVAKRQKQEQ